MQMFFIFIWFFDNQIYKSIWKNMIFDLICQTGYISYFVEHVFKIFVVIFGHVSNILSAEDRIEHYAFCPRTRSLVCSHLGLPRSFWTLSFFMLVDLSNEPYYLTLMAIAVYAVYRAFNNFRTNPCVSSSEVDDALRQYCKVATYGHAKSAAALDWALRGRFFKSRRAWSASLFA